MQESVKRGADQGPEPTSDTNPIAAPQPPQTREEREARQRAEILRFLGALLEPGDIVELRAKDFEVRPGFVAPGSGYYNDLGKLANDAIVATERASAVYVTLNQINPALLARRKNEFHWLRKGDPTTADSEVMRRRWLLVDLDPVRLSGISSTNTEHEAAIAKALEIHDALTSDGWPLPIMTNTGNGAALLYRIDLPPDDGDLVKRVLAGLSLRFSSAEVNLDTSVFNPARLVRLPGTRNRKGSHTDERPHRWCKILDLPEAIRPVPEEALRAWATEPEGRARDQARQSRHAAFDVERWVTDHLPGAEGPASWNGGGRKWVLPVCPWDPSHTNRSAYVLQLPSGAISAGCLHESCRARKWHDLRDAVEPGWREARHRSEPQVTPPSVRAKMEPYVLFPVDALPEPLRRFIVAGAAALGCDPTFLVLPVLAVAAGAIGNSRHVRIKASWEEPSILWAAIVAESGTLKSPALDKALIPVNEIQREEDRKYRKELKEFRKMELEYEHELKEWKKKAEGDPPEEPEPPIHERVLISDPTAEAAALILKENPRGILLARDELAGWLGAFDSYKTGQADGPFWLQAHRGGYHVIDRKTGIRHIAIPHVTVSICGCFQPKALARSLGAQHFENGLAARFLFAAPPRRTKKWTEATISPEVMLSYRSCVARLAGLSMRQVEGDDPKEKELEPHVLDFTAEAHEEFVRFYDGFAAEQAVASGNVASAFAKLEGYAARLSLIFELVEWAGKDTTGDPPQRVGLENMERAVEVVKWFAHEIPRVYALLSEDEAAAHQREQLEYLRARGGAATVREIQRSGTKLFGETAEEIEAYLETLVAKGLGEWEAVPPGAEGGRPCQRFRLREDLEPDGTPQTPEDFEVPSGQPEESSATAGGREPGDEEPPGGAKGEPVDPDRGYKEEPQPDGTPEKPEDLEVVSGVGLQHEPHDEGSSPARTRGGAAEDPDEEEVTWTA